MRAADLQAGVEVPLLRHLARMGRPLVGLGAMAPSSLPTVDLMHPTQIAKLFHRAEIERCLGHDPRPWARAAAALNPHFSLLWSSTLRRLAS